MSRDSAPKTWGHSPEQGQHPKAQGHGPGDTVQRSGDSGTAADHGQQPVTLPWQGHALVCWGQCWGPWDTVLLGTVPKDQGQCPHTGTGTVSCQEQCP